MEQKIYMKLNFTVLRAMTVKFNSIKYYAP